MQEKLQKDLSSGWSYGWRNGCLVTVGNVRGCILCVYVGTDPLTEERVQTQTTRATAVANAIQAYMSDDRYGIRDVSIVGNATVVCVSFGSGLGVEKKCSAFMDDHLAELAPLCEPRTCSYCGKPCQPGDPLVMAPNGAAPMHEDCLGRFTESIDNWSERDGKTYRTPLGVIGAIVGMLLGAALWTLIGMAGYVASIAALVMAFAIGKGYDLLGGKPGKFKVVLMIVLVILGIILGTAGVYAWQAHEFYAEETANLRPWETIVMSEGEFIMNIVKSVFTDPEYLPDTMKDIGLGLFFALLGCYSTVRAAGKHPDAPSKPRRLKGTV